jgi:hypothetical protein
VESVSAEIVLIEILGSHDRVQARERITIDDARRTFTIGRSVNADITLDDAHVAALHASVELNHGLMQIGRTRLRVRTTHETLAPEKPDQLPPTSILRDPAWIAGAGALAGGMQLAYSSWLGAPRDLATIIVTTLISGALAAGAWVAFWALLSRVMQGEWRWLRHAAIFLGVAAIFVAIDGVLELTWFVFSLPQWNTRIAWVGALAFGCALYLHLIYASNITSRRALLVACIIPALSGGTGQWVQARLQMRDVNYIATSMRIYPPSLRLRAAGTAEAYFRDATALRDAADKTRKAVRADDDEVESSDDE